MSSPETISLAGVPAGTYYAVVTPHTAGFGRSPGYTPLQITPPAATGDDAYEPNSDKGDRGRRYSRRNELGRTSGC